MSMMKFLSGLAEEEGYSVTIIGDGYALDETEREAERSAVVNRQRSISWEEQEAFFLRHADEWGPLREMGLIRAKGGAERFKDRTFWAPYDVLKRMEDEEDADRILYRIIRKYRHEIIGDVSRLGEPKGESFYHGAEPVCDTCSLQGHDEEGEQLFCMASEGCIMFDAEGNPRYGAERD